MAINRRAVLGLAASGLVSLAGGAWSAVPRRSEHRYLGIRYRRTLREFVAVVADSAGRSLHEIILPGRGHDVVARPGTRDAVVIARRPNTFAIAFDIDGEGAPLSFRTPFNRHFLGHAAFDAEGRLLFASENDFDRGRGVIGVYDAKDRYRRLGEFPSYGIGPHQLVMASDRRTIAVANGGIFTHPDSGRAKLNIPTMKPSLAYIDIQSGQLLDRVTMPQGRRRKLSTRHLALLPGDRIAVACQDEGPRNDLMSLVGIHTPGTGIIQELTAPDAVMRTMAGYCGAITADTAGEILAVSAPRGNLVVFWHVTSVEYLGMTFIADGCGVAPGPRPGTFALTSGGGVFAIHNPKRQRGVAAPATSTPRAPWDNHLTRIVL